MKRASFLKILIAALAAFLVVIFLAVLFSFFGKSYGKQVEIEIKPGTSLAKIATLLEQKKVIGRSFLFVIMAKLKGEGGVILPGRYRLRENMSYPEVFGVLKKGPIKKVFKVTIPEGLTIDDIAKKLGSTHLDKEKFEKFTKEEGKLKFQRTFLASNPLFSLEGYLFPKTYTLSEDADEAGFINFLLDQFGKEISTLDLSKAQARGLTLHQVVTVASLIEEEVKAPEERVLVSAVIYNRLGKNMPLKIDATIQYVLPQRKTKLTASDLKIDSVYNTYLHTGLPPGPICNPGLASLEAALNPAPVSYLYYVLTDPSSGRHTFTNTYEEFLEAKKRARK